MYIHVLYVLSMMFVSSCSYYAGDFDVPLVPLVQLVPARLMVPSCPVTFSVTNIRNYTTKLAMSEKLENIFMVIKLQCVYMYMYM